MVRKTILGVALLLSLAQTVAVAADTGAPAPGDFAPPSQGGSSVVASPVTTAPNGSVVASSAQDALNYADHALSGTLKAGQPGSTMVIFPSGVGWVAGATAGYQISANPNASALSMRAAYLIAYLKAKAELATCLSGLSVSATDQLRETLQAIDTADASMANTQSSWASRVDQAVEMMLHGFVVYDVADLKDQKAVFVSVAVTTKTLSATDAVRNITEGVVEATSVAAGLDYVIKKVSSGVVPPVGATLVTVPDTGETAVVSFGSAILRQNSNAGAQRTLAQAAERAAKAYANASMVAILQGDMTVWKGGVMETQDQSLSQFAQIGTNAADPASYAKMEESRESFLGRLTQADDYSSVVSGHLPPGVASRTYTQGQWVLAMNVYYPRLTALAKQMADSMQVKEKPVGAQTVALPPAAPLGINGRVTPDDDL